MAADQEADILHVTIGQFREAATERIDNTIFLRVLPETLEIVGWEVLGLQSLFADSPEGYGPVVKIASRMAEHVASGPMTINGSAATAMTQSLRELVPS